LRIGGGYIEARRPHVERPCRCETLDILGRDLPQWGMAHSARVLAVTPPFLFGANGWSGQKGWTRKQSAENKGEWPGSTHDFRFSPDNAE